MSTEEGNGYGRTTSGEQSDEYAKEEICMDWRVWWLLEVMCSVYVWCKSVSRMVSRVSRGTWMACVDACKYGMKLEV